MKELLEKLLVYFKQFQAKNCNCVACVEAREWIKQIEDILKNDTRP